MALGGAGYWHSDYWHKQYWHANYWAGSDVAALPLVPTGASEARLGFVYLFYERLPPSGFYPGMLALLYISDSPATLYYWDHVARGWTKV